MISTTYRGVRLSHLPLGYWVAVKDGECLFYADTLDEACEMVDAHLKALKELSTSDRV